MYIDYVSTMNHEMASSGLRVLGLAIRKVSVQAASEILASKQDSESEKDLVFLGLIGLIDPAK